MQAQISTSIRFMIFSSANWRASDKVYAYRLKLTHFISLTNDWFIVIRISITTIIVTLRSLLSLPPLSNFLYLIFFFCLGRFGS